MIAAVCTSLHESWQRDLLRVKDGITDNCVMGEIDVQTLRHSRAAIAYRPSRSCCCRMDLILILATRQCRRETENE